MKKNSRNEIYKKKVALISGITGQDGSYLAELLIQKGYQVHGILRRSSIDNTDRVSHLISCDDDGSPRLKLHYGDLTDSLNIVSLMSSVRPDEIYNLGAQSDVAVSFDTPEYTAQVDALGALRFLEAVRILKLEKKTRFYQASSSELFGRVVETPQSEITPFYPRSPYAVAKLYAYWITVNYREAYGIYACNGILFNHESPRRGLTFVTRKITSGFAEIALGKRQCLHLGNLNALRDWGHARDYVEMQWRMLQQTIPEDFVIATGVQYTVREFITWTAKELGLTIAFEGEGDNEVGIVTQIKGKKTKNIKIGDVVVRVNAKYYRPTEVDSLVGNAEKARAKLGWSSSISAQEMCSEMLKSDMNRIKRETSNHIF